MARRIDREGSPLERERLGSRLIAVLDYADPGTGDSRGEQDRFQELWQVAGSLLYNAQRGPLTIIDGRLIERELESFLPDAAAHPIAAKRERLHAHSIPAARHGPVP